MNDLSYIDPAIALPTAAVLWLTWCVQELRARKLERDRAHQRDSRRAADGVLAQRTEHRSADDGVQHRQANGTSHDREHEDKPESSIIDHALMLPARRAS